MTTRTVRFDEEAEKTLAQIRKTTGLSISAVLKQGFARLPREDNPHNSGDAL